VRHVGIPVFDWWRAPFGGPGSRSRTGWGHNTANARPMAPVESLAARQAWHPLGDAVAPWLCVPPFRRVCYGQRRTRPTPDGVSSRSGHPATVSSHGATPELPRCDVATAQGRLCSISATRGSMFSSSKWLQWNSDETARYLSRHRSGRLFRDGEVFAGRGMSRRGPGPGWTLWTLWIMRTTSCLPESPAAQRNPFSYRSIRSAPALELPP